MKRFWRWSSAGFVQGEAPEKVQRLVGSSGDLRRHDSFLILPPLWDHHGHLLQLGALNEEIDLRGAKTVGEALALVRSKAASSAGRNEWLLGFGWDQNLWGGTFPHRRELDEAAGGRPAYLRRVDGHAAWMNSVALSVARLGGNSPDPAGGRLMRDGGGLTGIIMDNAMVVAEAAIPAISSEGIKRRALAALGELERAGLSGATDMGLRAEESGLLADLDHEGKLPIPVRAFLNQDPLNWKNEWGFRGEAFRVEGAKLFADGSLGSRTAALSGGYDDAAGNNGLLLLPAGAIRERLAAAHSHGISVAVHVIGDEALEALLEAMEHPGNLPPVRAEHLQVASSSQLERLSRLRLAASVQPCHWLSDKGWAPRRLGEKRMAWAYRLGSLAKAGLPLLAGTDFPIEPPDPCRTIFSALARDENERLSFGEVMASMRPPEGAVTPEAVTLVAGAAPGDLGDPERILSWDLKRVSAGVMA